MSAATCGVIRTRGCRQTAWSAGKWDEARPFVTDPMYETLRFWKILGGGADSKKEHKAAATSVLNNAMSIR